jgi:hypothetical protein
MMSRRIARLCLALALCGGAILLAVTWNGGAQNFDRNDHAAVLGALEAATGNTFRPDSLCIALPEHFPALVIVEALLPDAGCRFQGVLVRGRWERASAGLLDRLTQEMLAARGWALADADTRRTLAMQWMVEVLYPGRAVSDPAMLDPRLRSAGITAPASEVLPDGGIVVRLWIINTTIAGPQPTRVTFVIGPDGAPGH